MNLAERREEDYKTDAYGYLHCKECGSYDCGEEGCCPNGLKHLPSCPVGEREFVIHTAQKLHGIKS